MNGAQWAIAIALVLLVGGGTVALNMNQPRGIRNNNPGNIRKGANWQGLADVQQDSSFATFVSPEYGLRALARTLRTYQKSYGINTIRAAISRWAPPIENNTDAYIKSVADQVGASADAPLDFTKQSVVIPMMQAITKHENGQQPYAYSIFARGAELAGATA